MRKCHVCFCAVEPWNYTAHVEFHEDAAKNMGAIKDILDGLVASIKTVTNVLKGLVNP